VSRQFDGVDDNIEVASHGTYDLSIHTVAFWMRVNNPTVVNGMMIHGRHGSSGSLRGFLAYLLSNGRVGLICKNATANVIDLAGTTSVVDDIWHHVALVLRTANGATNRIYVDGVEQVSGNASASWSYNGQVLRWGQSINAFWDIYPGLLAEGAWWNEELDPSEIRVLGLDRQYPSVIRPGSLLGYWPFLGVNNPELNLARPLHTVRTAALPAAHPPLDYSRGIFTTRSIVPLVQEGASRALQRAYAHIV
jgi:concanavalin A-like lectin/glucanase superfamily protein